MSVLQAILRNVYTARECVQFDRANAEQALRDYSDHLEDTTRVSATVCFRL